MKKIRLFCKNPNSRKAVSYQVYECESGELAADLIIDACNQEHVSMARLWETAIQFRLNGLRVYSLSPEYQILYLSVHLFKHMMAGSITLYWFSDIHEVTRMYNDKIDWKAFWNSAGSLGFEAQTCSVFELLRSQWNGSFPEMDSFCTSAEIDKPCIKTIGWPQFKKARNIRNVLHNYIERLQTTMDIKGWRWRLYYLWRTIFPARANLIHRYHPGNSYVLPLYYIIHPCILCKRATISLFYNIYSFFKRRKKSI